MSETAAAGGGAVRPPHLGGGAGGGAVRPPQLGEEIPFWIFGQQKWVSGINKNTTCQEVGRQYTDEATPPGQQTGSVCGRSRDCHSWPRSAAAPPAIVKHSALLCANKRYSSLDRSTRSTFPILHRISVKNNFSCFF